MLSNVKNRNLIHQLYQKPHPIEVYPTWEINRPNYFHQIDVLYFTNDHGFKYILTCIDLHNSLCGAVPLKKLTIEYLITQLESLYQKSDYLKYPEVLQADNQFSKAPFRKWCQKNNIYLKITEPYEHRQQAHVERLNQTLGKVLWKLQVDQELETNKPYTLWVQWLDPLIEEINQKRMRLLTPWHQRQLPVHQRSSTPIVNPKVPILDVGTKVRLALRQPEDLQGNKLTGTFRATDPRWGLHPVYEIEEFILQPNQPVMYRIKNAENGHPFNHLVVREDLQEV